MVNLYKQDGEILYGIKEFILDSIDDLSNLPTNIRSGSSALIIPTGEVYFLNGSKTWTAVGSENSNNGSVANCSCEEILSQLDADKDGVVDMAEEAMSFIMEDM